MAHYTDYSELISTDLPEVTVPQLGRSFPVKLIGGSGIRVGTFVIELPGGDHLEADSHTQLWKKAQDYKPKRFRLEFSTARREGVEHGAVTGFHASSGNMLVDWGERGKAQLHTYQGAMRHLTDEETAELGYLIAERNKIEGQIAGFSAAHQFPEGDLKAAARAEQERVISDGR